MPWKAVVSGLSREWPLSNFRRPALASTRQLSNRRDNSKRRGLAVCPLLWEEAAVLVEGASPLRAEASTRLPERYPSTPRRSGPQSIGLKQFPFRRLCDVPPGIAGPRVYEIRRHLTHRSRWQLLP